MFNDPMCQALEKMTEFMYVWYYNKKYFYIYDFINFLLQLCEVAVGTPPLHMKKQALLRGSVIYLQQQSQQVAVWT